MLLPTGFCLPCPHLLLADTTTPPPPPAPHTHPHNFGCRIPPLPQQPLQVYRVLAERRSGPGEAGVTLGERLEDMTNALLQVGRGRGGGCECVLPPCFA
jgi:hypothetical protein